jgi:hypothetical protein
MDKCPNCGNKINTMDVLCPRCGAVVEDVKIKNNTRIINTLDYVSQAPAVKKDFPQNFIVYNEDFPSDESEALSTGGAYVSDNKTADKPEDSGYGDTDADNSPESITEEYFLPEQAMTDEPVVTPEGLGAQSPEAKELAEDTYSERYLNRIKENSLPEIDDISNFDPDEYMRKYRESKKAQLTAEETGTDEPAEKKRWLEIEEVITPEETVASPEASHAPLNQASEYEQDIQRRYNPQRRSNSVKDISFADKKAGEPVEKYRARKERRRVPAALSLLIWIIIAAALFTGFMFFDRFVKTTYGNYGSLIYSITDGKIDLGHGSSS